EAPTAACDETTVVGIGRDNPNDCYYGNAATCEFAGVTWVRATTFDDGSFDLCSNIKFTIRRAAPYSDCINDLDNTPCPGNPLGMSEFETATAESDSIKFYCCEVGTELKVILRVYQLNPDGTISTLPDGTPIYNECEVLVQVQDNLRPVCEAPFNVTVNCENFDPSLWTYGKPNVTDNCCLDTGVEYQGQKGLTHSVNYNQFDSVCNKGTIIRTFRVTDCHGQTTQCTQRIIVNYHQNYFIKFPDDAVVNTCDGTGLYGEPQLFGEDCELLGVSYQDQVYTVVPDACFKIERTWKIINWCTYNPADGCIVVPNPTPHPNSTHASNNPGPIVSPQGTLAPWAPTVVKITPNDQAATNYSIYWNQNANCYEYKQIIKIVDHVAPQMTCPASPIEFCDFSSNDPTLWNESYWWEQAIQSNDMNEAPVDLTITATDLCSGANLNIRYLLFLDLDGNGSMETVVSSTNAPAAGTVNFNNANTPNFSGVTPRTFDERAVAPNQKYRFGMETTVNGTTVTASVRWNTPVTPGLYSLPQLPYGTHKIKWIASDGCGNESVCEYEFSVKDCEAPTVVCMNGLTGNLTQMQMITLFASDFLLHADDNSTPDDFLTFGVRKCGQGTGFPLDGNGNPQISITFDCNELGPQCVELWGMDAFGNADYCETYMIIQDNGGNCGNASATVAGLLKTEMNDGLEETDVELAGPVFNLFDITDQDGHFSFQNAVPMSMNYTITPTKDDNPLNGVTTFDLVLISKHILGLEPLNSPYKMIAADANRSGSITTFDIVELRKLILGIYTELPSNESWRFVDKSFVFPNPANPFQTSFPEEKTVLDIQANAMADDFVGVKVGDVNGSAIANSLMSAEERSAGALLFDVDDRDVKAGEVFELKFKAAEKVAGYQFTLHYNDLDLVDVTPGPGMKSENFGTFATENAITTSFDGNTQGEFTLKFKARKAGELSKMIGISSQITKAESYQYVDGDGKNIQRQDVALRFNGKNGSTISGVGFELYQNQPNPFVNRTLIGFHLPEATSATLSIFDQAGRLVYSQKGDFPKGYNSIPLDRALINANGVLYYKLETATDSATRTMIQVK
ncbi:MAG: T9SS type A sorting domain-containing protein, partial [Saprospiraceae bacterium]|nr:T9SS type A sorting domain-containing protein [Saprospiraceae bacterium]